MPTMSLTLYNILSNIWQYLVAHFFFYASSRSHQSSPKDSSSVVLDLGQGTRLKRKLDMGVSSDPHWTSDQPGDHLARPSSFPDGLACPVRPRNPPGRSTSPCKVSRMKMRFSSLAIAPGEVYSILRTCAFSKTSEARPILPVVRDDLTASSSDETRSGIDIQTQLSHDGSPKNSGAYPDERAGTMSPVSAEKPKRKRPSVVWFAKFKRSTVLELLTEHRSSKPAYQVEEHPTSRSLDLITVPSNDEKADATESARAMALVLQALAMNEETDDVGEELKRRLARESEWTIGRSLGFNSQVSLQHINLSSWDLGSRFSRPLHRQTLISSKREPFLPQSTSSELPYLRPQTIRASVGLGLALAIRDDPLRTLEARIFGIHHDWASSPPHRGHDDTQADDDYEWEAVSQPSSSSLRG